MGRVIGFWAKSDDLGLRILKSDFIPSDFAKSDCTRPILMQSDWEDRKGRFPIHNLFDEMCLDTFLIVSRIELSGGGCFGALSGGV